MTSGHPPRTAIRLPAIGLAVLAALSGCGGSSDQTGPGAVPATITFAATDTFRVAAGVTIPLAVTVRDQDARAVAGATVTWAALGGGTADPATSKTDASGLASTAWHPATSSGTHAVSAAVAGAPTARAVAIVSPGAPAALDAITVGTRSATVGRLFDSSFAVRAVDAFGNPTPGAAVRWSARGGVPSAARTTTDSAGRTSVSLIAGQQAGTVALSAALESDSTASGDSVVFDARAMAGPIRFVMFSDSHRDGVFTVAPGDTVSPDANAFDATGNQVGGTYPTFRRADVPFVFRSLDGAVATVDPLGVVTAQGLGVARIIATVPPIGSASGRWPLDSVVASTGAADTTTFRVVERVTRVEITAIDGSWPPPDVQGIGGSVDLVATVFDVATGDEIPDAAVVWTTLKPAVASVDARGRVVGVTAGLALVSAASGSDADTVQLRVNAAVARTVLTPRNVYLNVGETVQFTARAVDASGSTVGNDFEWVTEDPSTVAVSGSGLARALAPGWSRITPTGYEDQRSAFVAVRPASLTGTLRLASVSAGSHVDGTVTCGLAQSGNAYCWGVGPTGQLGNGSTGGTTDPVRVSGGPWKALDAGAGTNCALDGAGAAWCWGEVLDPARDSTVSPSCGNVAGRCALVPSAVPGGLTFSQVSVGGEGITRYRVNNVYRHVRMTHACALTPAGKAYCWGSNTHGQLGIGTQSRSPGGAAPVAVAGELAFTAITAGAHHTCGLTGGGQAWCWGSNRYGELGIGSQPPVGDTLPVTAVPTPVAGGLAFRSISAGKYHTCAVTTGGALYCWGIDKEQQLGTAQPLATCSGQPCATAPVAVAPSPASPDVRYLAVSAGVTHSCATGDD